MTNTEPGKECIYHAPMTAQLLLPINLSSNQSSQSSKNLFDWYFFCTELSGNVSLCSLYQNYRCLQFERDTLISFKYS